MNFRYISIQLIREDSSTPWGFRLEGGIDVNQPLNIQKVTPGSVADRSGLCTGDYVVQINQSRTDNMRHEDAKMEIIRSSNDIEMIVQRYFKASLPLKMVQAMPVQCTQVINPHKTIWVTTNSPVVKSKHPQPAHTLHSYVEAAQNVYSIPPPPGKHYITQTSEDRFKRNVRSAYNTPVSMYSPKNLQSPSTNMIHASSKTMRPLDSAKSGMICGTCGNYIQGVFVKVQGRIPMHPECLKCCKCGVGLRNSGYFYFNDALYCDAHASQATPAPKPGMKPVLVYK